MAEMLSASILEILEELDFAEESSVYDANDVEKHLEKLFSSQDPYSGLSQPAISCCGQSLTETEKGEMHLAPLFSQELDPLSHCFCGNELEKALLPGRLDTGRLETWINQLPDCPENVMELVKENKENNPPKRDRGATEKLNQRKAQSVATYINTICEGVTKLEVDVIDNFPFERSIQRIPTQFTRTVSTNVVLRYGRLTGTFQVIEG